MVKPKGKPAATAKRVGGGAASGARSGKSGRAAGERARVAAIIDALDALYPEAHCELHFDSPFQLLVATILSAQCTDKLVNQVTPHLFARFPDAHALGAADPGEVERLVAKTGFFRQKARNIVATAQQLVEEHEGEVPRVMDQLTRLPGVARKTGNVVLGSAYGMNEGIAVDTHVMRLSGRLGLTTETEPKKIEPALLAIFPRERWTLLGHQIIWHGRRVCDARKPACDRCALAPYCPSVDLTESGSAAASGRRGAARSTAKKAAASGKVAATGRAAGAGSAKRVKTPGARAARKGR